MQQGLSNLKKMQQGLSNLKIEDLRDRAYNDCATRLGEDVLRSGLLVWPMPNLLEMIYEDLVEDHDRRIMQAENLYGFLPHPDSMAAPDVDRRIIRALNYDRGVEILIRMELTE